MKKKAKISVFALFAVLLLSVGFVSAFPSEKMGAGRMEGNNVEMQEFRESVRSAVEFEDYETWRNLMMSKVNEDRFNELKERHQEMSEFRIQIQEARENGDFESMKELREEFGKTAKMRGSCSEEIKRGF